MLHDAASNATAAPSAATIAASATSSRTTSRVRAPIAKRTANSPARSAAEARSRWPTVVQAIMNAVALTASSQSGIGFRPRWSGPNCVRSSRAVTTSSPPGTPGASTRSESSSGRSAGTPGRRRPIMRSQNMRPVKLDAEPNASVPASHSGSQTSGRPRSTPRNPGGATPTIVTAAPFSISVRPSTPGSRANRRSQYP